MFQYWDIIATLVFLAAYLYLFRRHAYWTSRNVPFRQPDFFYGNTRPAGRTEQVGKFFRQFYADFKELHPLVGMYHYLRPIGLVTDLELVKRILEVDFECFQGRGSYCDERHDVLSTRLYNLTGKRWENVHNIIVTMFRTDKINVVYSMVSTFGKQLNNLLSDKVVAGIEIDIRDLLEQCTSEMIGKCYFGIDFQFKTIPRQGKCKRFLVNCMPKLAKILRIKEFDPQISKNFLKELHDVMDSRFKNNIKKDDLLDMLIQPRNSSDLLDFNEIAAQALGFYLAGFETYPTLLTWTLYELANAQVLQKKARKHVKTLLTKFNSQMSYESINSMTFLDQIVKESLRKYPPMPVLIRETTKPYQIPNTTTTLDAGTPIYIPVYAIQHDPDLYPTPEKFDPERFSPKNESPRNPYAWIPFGEGPRTCLGMQLSLMQTKIVLANLLINFQFAIGKKCGLPLEVDVKSFVLTPKDLWLKVERI